MHYFEKMLSASGSFTPRLPPGLCRWTLLGDFRPSDPLIAHPWKKYPARAHVNILQKWPNFRLTWFGSAYHTQIWSRSVPNSENNAPMKNWFTCIVFNLAARAAAPHQLEVHWRLGPRLNMKPRLEHFAYPLFTGEGGGKKWKKIGLDFRSQSLLMRSSETMKHILIQIKTCAKSADEKLRWFPT